jgi:hypothetical protein
MSYERAKKPWGLEISQGFEKGERGRCISPKDFNPETDEGDDPHDLLDPVDPLDAFAIVWCSVSVEFAI